MMKERIRAAWGEGMKETADGVLAAMHADWKKFRELEAAEEAKAGPRGPARRAEGRAQTRAAIRAKEVLTCRNPRLGRRPNSVIRAPELR